MLDFNELSEPLRTDAAKMKIWRDNWQTDPAFAKEVKFGGRHYTAISAHYKMERMTKYFGPCGNGWGFAREVRTEGLPEFPGTYHAVCDLILWYRVYVDGQEVRGVIPSMGAANLYSEKKAGQWVADTDAWKKAETDALTKAFSRLGFFSDVFLGMFDDDKYLEFLNENPPVPGSPDIPVTDGRNVSQTTVADARRVMEDTFMIVPDLVSAEVLQAAARICLKMIGFGQKRIDALVKEYGEPNAASLMRRAVHVLDIMINAYKGGADTDWLAHAKQVRQLVEGEVPEPGLELDPAADDLWEQQP